MLSIKYTNIIIIIVIINSGQTAIQTEAEAAFISFQQLLRLQFLLL